MFILTARALTVRRCIVFMLFLVSLFRDVAVSTLGFRIQDTGNKNRAVTQSLMTSRLFHGWRGFKGMNNSIRSVSGSFKQPGCGVRRTLRLYD